MATQTKSVPAIHVTNPQEEAMVGDLLHVYSTRWSGPRPGVVVGTHSVGKVNVNVMFDGYLDTEALAIMRQAPSGNTLQAVPLFQPLTPEKRATVLDETKPRQWTHKGDQIKIVAEWPSRG